ncbi:MAG: hypothetical protein FJ197_09765 [Gammaproteobacteria bacterium]|nr:hypothetical protein [Gammaproteobacteria bacterium]
MTDPAADAPARRSPLDSGYALAGGIAFSLAFCLLIWWTQQLWPAPPPYGVEIPGFWYEWQLEFPTVWSRATAWGGYLLHQLTLWWLIWKAQEERPAYTRGLHPINVAALGANAFFIALHLVQTRIWYDGLAQDVHEATSFASVAVMLVIILIMENQRRGLFFGKPLRFVTEAGQVARRYHGYYFAWAAIYTFWYHPMDATSGHLIGFFYMFLLLLQGSLFFTRTHVNRWWTLTLEMMVIVHAILVAIMNQHGFANFVAGLLGIFVITQVYGLPWSQRTRLAVSAAYVAGVIALYAAQGRLERAWTALSIPFWDYVAVFAFSAVIVAVARRLRGRAAPG